jgi:hypothetical protein
MAKLVIKTNGVEGQVIELRLGTNRIGRSQSNDFVIEHSTISGQHCELVLANDQVLLRDKESTNGTFVNDQPVQEAILMPGQMVRLGDVELFVESADVSVAIPKFELPHGAPPPVVLDDGGVLCPRHARARVTHQCTFCKEVMCDACVHRLRRRGGKLLKLCPICSHKVELIGGEGRRRKGFLGFLQKTVKLPFLRGASRREDEA